MRESKVEAYFKQRVVETGGMTRKARWIGHDGCPDRWCGWPSTLRRGWVELKGDGGRLSKLQEREIERLRACGERVDVLSTVEEVDWYVAEMSRTLPRDLWLTTTLLD